MLSDWLDIMATLKKMQNSIKFYLWTEIFSFCKSYSIILFTKPNILCFRGHKNQYQMVHIGQQMQEGVFALQITG